VIGCGDDHGIDPFLLLKQDAVVFVSVDLGHRITVTFLRITDLILVHIAEGREVVAKLEQLADMPLDLSTHADGGDAEFVRGLLNLSVTGQSDGGSGGGEKSAAFHD
jgi:hypothetical protein